MVSVWGEKCQDCQKQKSEIFKLKGNKKFKHILLNEHAREINEFLCCNDCSKMVNVLSDMRAFEKANGQMNETQKQIYKVVKMCPFPKTIKGLKEILNDTTLKWFSRNNDLSLLKKCLNKSTFPIIKHYYSNLYVENIYNDYFVKYGHREVFEEEINKKKIRFGPNILLKKYIKYYVEYFYKHKDYGTPTFTAKEGKIFDYPYHKYFKFCKIDGFNYNNFLSNIYRRTI